MFVISIVFFLVPALMLFGYQSVLESKGINDPTLALSLYKTTILLDIPIKLLLYWFILDVDVLALTSLFVHLPFFVWFYADLSLNIPKAHLRKFRKFPQETNYTLCACKVVGWCTLTTIFNAAILLMMSINYEDPFMFYIMSGFIIIMMSFYMILMARSLVRLDRLKYPSMRSLTALSHNNSPIVFLRSFKIDSTPTVSGKVFDETICENLDLEENPIISLANPDEVLPSGGSLKIQAKDSEWKEVVKEILKNCRAVILVEGQSDGLHWEISKLKDYLSSDQLYVLVPAKKYRELAWCYNDEAGAGLYSIIRNGHRVFSYLTVPGKKATKNQLNSIWSDFSLKLRSFGIYTPEEFPGNECIIGFDDQWNGIVKKDICNMREMLKYVISRTADFNNSDFDYGRLAEKISSYEVNGFLNKKEIAPFKKIVDKYTHRGVLLASIFSLAFIAVLILTW